MNGGALGTALIGAIMAFAGCSFARLGWLGVRRRTARPAAGRELAPPPPMASLPWKLLWALLLLFGLFALVCGLLLALSPFLPE